MKCPNCGNKVELFKKFCKNCGCRISWKNYWIAIIISSIVIITAWVIILLFCNYKSKLETVQTMQLKKTFSTIDQALAISQTLESESYTKTDDIIEKAIVKQLKTKQEKGNTITLVDDTILTFNKLNDDAYYEIIITPDVKFLGIIRFKNYQKHYHIYGYGYNIFAEQNTPEAKILNN